MESKTSLTFMLSSRVVKEPKDFEKDNILDISDPTC